MMDVLVTGEVYVWIMVGLWLGAMCTAELQPIAIRESAYNKFDR